MGHTAIDGDRVEHVTNLRDWLAVEADFRAGLISIRQIAAKAGNLTEAAIRKRARRLGWTRDLTARIRAQADELVRSPVRSLSAQYDTDSETVIQDNAQLLAHVEVMQRKHISRARAVVMNLFAELEAATSDVTAGLIRDPSDLRRDDSASRQADGIGQKRWLSLSARAAAAKSLSDALRTLVSLERQAWQMDDAEPDTVNARPIIDSSRLTWQERQQLRAMILRASDEVAPAIANESLAVSTS